MKSFTVSKMLKCDVDGEIYGEDGPPVAITDTNNRFMIGAFDGMGGRGSTRCIDNKTQAHHGAHAVSRASNEYFCQKIKAGGSVNQDELEQAISKHLKEVSDKFKRPAQSMLKGKLSTQQGGEFPTTAVITHNLSNQLELLWAGDSRAYGLFESGFFPLTEDHVSKFELFPVSSSPLLRYLHTNSSKLAQKRIYQTPIALIVCSDGLFDAHPYPPSLAGDITTIFHYALTQNADLKQLFDKYLNKVTWSDDVSISGVLLKEDKDSAQAVQKLYESYQSASKMGESLRELVIEQHKRKECDYALTNEISELRERINKQDTQKREISDKIEEKKKEIRALESKIKENRKRAQEEHDDLKGYLPQGYERLDLINIDSDDEEFDIFKVMITENEWHHNLQGKEGELEEARIEYTNYLEQCDAHTSEINRLTGEMREMARKMRKKITALNEISQRSSVQDEFECFNELPSLIADLQGIHETFVKCREDLDRHEQELKECRPKERSAKAQKEQKAKERDDLKREWEKRKKSTTSNDRSFSWSRELLSKIKGFFKSVLDMKKQNEEATNKSRKSRDECAKNEEFLKELKKDLEENKTKEQEMQEDISDNAGKLSEIDDKLQILRDELKSCTDKYLESFKGFNLQEQLEETSEKLSEVSRKKEESQVAVTEDKEPQTTGDSPHTSPVVK